MRQFLQSFLASLSREILSKYKPIIIGITGSVGKTSTKEAVFCVVSQKYKTRKSKKNFNNEIGLPLTIIGADAPGRNVFKWIAVFFKAVLLIITPQKYPQVLVLEMGVDRPGDMDYLLSIAKPHIAIITAIGYSHYEFFKDEGSLDTEKGRIIEVLSEIDFAILNADDKRAAAQKNKTKAEVYTYGFTGQGAQITNVSENVSAPLQGVSTTFTAITKHKTFTTTLYTLGTTHISSIAAAIATAEILNIDTQSIANGIREYKPVPGRLNIIAGIKKSVLIDDTYNAAPDSTKTALAVLQKVPGQYKIAVLGDMLELGPISDKAHREIGKLVASMHIQKLLTVGPSGKIIAQSAIEHGMDKDTVIMFDTSVQAGVPLQNMLPPGAIVLIKGSQGVRMEKITKEIMAEPMRAEELLCRQYGKWITT